jgi:aspartyl-tRNA(Asn)/glutamyl-tRNA(Gln) amidotransferase subunit C
MSITRKDVEKIAELSRLETTPEEADLLAGQLSAILSYIEKLNEIDTTDIEPMSHCASAENDFEYTKRDDEVGPSLGQGVAVENAPDSERGYFKVPRVI